MTAPVRVTQVVFDLDGGGLETLVGEMARRWAGSNVVVSIVTLSGRAGRVGERVRSLVDQFHVVKPLPVVSMALPLGLSRVIRATRPDAVHLHSGAWYKSALASKLAGVRRVVYTEHGREHFDPPMMQRLDRIAARWTDVVAPVSERLGRYLARVVGVGTDRITVIPNGVDPQVFAPRARSAALLQSLRLPANALVLGSLGRLERVKRYDRLVDTIAQLPAELDGRPVFLVLGGEGSERGALEAQARTLGVTDRVRMPGWMAEPPEAQRLLDVFSLTSDSEGMSVSLLEAMSVGGAPLVMDVGANAELLGPEHASHVVAAGDLDAFVKAASGLLSDAARRQRAGQALRQRVLDRYTLAGMMAAYERAYRGTATGPARAA